MRRMSTGYKRVWRSGNVESDGDYHLVLTDDTLSYGDEGANPPVPPTGHSFIGEMPDPNCLSGSDGSFGSQTPFADGMISARQAMEQRFPNPDQSGAWNDGAGAPVEITGIGFFDRPHKQAGRAPNNIEIHPILSIRFLDHPTPSTSPTPTPRPQPSPTGNQWEYQMISADNTTDLLNQANTQGTQGWELPASCLTPVAQTNTSDFSNVRSSSPRSGLCGMGNSFCDGVACHSVVAPTNKP
jgi:hypothetical protein